MKRKIYAYNFGEDVVHLIGWIKVGDTTRKEVKERIIEQTHTPNLDKYTVILGEWDAYDIDGNEFRDYKIHQYLKKQGIEYDYDGDYEWFKCSIEDIEAAIYAIKNHKENEEKRFKDFSLRQEQQDFVDKTYEIFMNNNSKVLWNAKMRFGKCFTTYKLAQKLQCKNILIVSFMTNVKNSWHDDLMQHIDFEGWHFYDASSSTLNFVEPYAYFISAQDLTGLNNNDIKEKNTWIFNQKWDFLVLDEYHYGLHNMRTNYFLDNINCKYTLCLSGTPFNVDEDFDNEHKLSYSYIDEQNNKKNYNGNSENPYAIMPEMNLITLKINPLIKQNFNEFSLTNLFRAEKGEFKDKDSVGLFLNSMYAPLQNDILNNPKGENLPYCHSMLSNTNVSMWVMDRVESCQAMHNLLSKDPFFSNYKIFDAYDGNNGTGMEAEERLKQVLKNNDKVIILTIKTLTTGATIPELGAVFMLTDTISSIHYWQTGFRAQSPNKNKNKEKCFIFDYATDRALQVFYDLAYKTSKKSASNEKLIELAEVLPIIAYNGNQREEISIEKILEKCFSKDIDEALQKAWGEFINQDFVDYSNKIVYDILSPLNGIKKNGKNEKKKIPTPIVNNGFIKPKNTTTIMPKDSTTTDEKENILKLKKEQTIKEKTLTREQIKEKLRQITQAIPYYLATCDYKIYNTLGIIKSCDIDENVVLFESIFPIDVNQFEQLCIAKCFDEEKLDVVIYNYQTHKQQWYEYLTTTA